MLLNHNYGFWRITQLFNRSLYIKYYRKDRKVKKENDVVPQQFIGFDGNQEADIGGDAMDEPKDEFGDGFDDQAYEDPGVAIIDGEQDIEQNENANFIGLHNIEHLQINHSAG